MYCSRVRVRKKHEYLPIFAMYEVQKYFPAVYLASRVFPLCKIKSVSRSVNSAVFQRHCVIKLIKTTNKKQPAAVIEGCFAGLHP